jgi:hypothetical protein
VGPQRTHRERVGKQASFLKAGFSLVGGRPATSRGNLGHQP